MHQRYYFNSAIEIFHPNTVFRISEHGCYGVGDRRDFSRTSFCFSSRIRISRACGPRNPAFATGMAEASGIFDICPAMRKASPFLSGEEIQRIKSSSDVEG